MHLPEVAALSESRCALSESPFPRQRLDGNLNGGFYPKQKRASHAAQADIVDDCSTAEEGKGLADGRPAVCC